MPGKSLKNDRRTQRKIFEIRGVLLDSSVVMERRTTYKRLIDFFQGWGYNILLLHFCDDAGSSIRFPSMPQLAGKRAFSAKEIANLVEYADKRGIEVIPELESLGHTGYITERKEFAHLRDGIQGKQFAAICPVHPETRRIFSTLISDLSKMFRSKYIHVGLDEASLGSNPMTIEMLKNKKKYEIYAEYVCWLHSEVAKHGKQMMMWGDHLLANLPETLTNLDLDAISPKIAEMIPKDIIVCHWHYIRKPPSEPVNYLIKKGFQVVACPATSAWGIVGHPAKHNLENVRNLTAIAASINSEKMMGVINTVWRPQRWLTGTSLYGIAYGAVCMKNGGKVPSLFADKFGETAFGIKGNSKIMKAIEILHQIAPDDVPFFSRVCPSTKNEIQPLSRDDLLSIKERLKFAKIAYNYLASGMSTVKFNHDFYEQILFAAKALKTVFSSCLNLQNAYKRTNGKLTALDRKALRKEALMMKKLFNEGLMEWKKTRYDKDRDNDIGNDIRCYDRFIRRLGANALLLKSFDKSL